MLYSSTRGEAPTVAFEQTVLNGLAPDRGLYLPHEVINVKEKLPSWQKLNFEQLTFQIISLYATDIPNDDLKDIIKQSYQTFTHREITPVVKLKTTNILELFHGPTLAFKDIALQFLGNLYTYILDKTGKNLNILGATSGDTGSAAIEGVRGKHNINIFVMYPCGRVSTLQELQMTSVLEDNVFNLAIKGSFDDCQKIMKDIFGELSFKEKVQLGSVNSINWARILAQIPYYFYSYFRSVSSVNDKVNFAVPTGNFGDIFAGYLAKKMGLPIDKLILSTNENSILADFFTKGVYQKGQVQQTISPSMDIQVASNFERYLYFHCQKKTQKLTQLMQQFEKEGKICLPFKGEVFDSDFLAYSSSKENTLQIIKKYYEQEGYLLDPHTATGVYAMQQVKSSYQTICLSTAHPAKFPVAIEQALGKDIARHPILEKLKNAPTRNVTLSADKEVVKKYMMDNI